MRNIIAAVESLKIPLSEITLWDETLGVIEAEDLEAGLNLLGAHRTQRGNGGCLCYWMQHYFDLCAQPPPGRCRGSLFPLVDSGENEAFWRVNMAGQPLPNLGRMHEVRNPWYSDAGGCLPCFYFTPIAGAEVDTEIFFSSPDAVQVDYVIAGRLIGFDFPRKYLDNQEAIGRRL